MVSNPQISEVLKALNHSIRRDILIFLAERERETTFSELMDILEFTNSSSGQFSYHLKLLSVSNLIDKTPENKYLITELGKRAYSLMSLANTEEEETVASKIVFSFKNLTPIDQVMLGFIGYVFGLFGISFSLFVDNPSFSDYFVILFLFLVISTSLLLIFLYFSYRKLRYPPSMIVLTSIIWVVLLPENQLKIGWIYAGSLIGTMLTWGAISQYNSNPADALLQFISGFVIIIATLVTAFFIINEERKNKKIS